MLSLVDLTNWLDGKWNLEMSVLQVPRYGTGKLNCQILRLNKNSYTIHNHILPSF